MRFIGYYRALNSVKDFFSPVTTTITSATSTVVEGVGSAYHRTTGVISAGTGAIESTVGALNQTASAVHSAAGSIKGFFDTGTELLDTVNESVGFMKEYKVLPILITVGVVCATATMVSIAAKKGLEAYKVYREINPKTAEGQDSSSQTSQYQHYGPPPWEYGGYRNHNQQYHPSKQFPTRQPTRRHRPETPHPSYYDEDGASNDWDEL